MGKRVLAVGDVHGCSKTFKRLLDVIGLDRTDTLYLLGDLIDRGPDSKGVIETILKMMEVGLNVQVCKGNHEQMLLDAVRSGVFETLLEWLENGGTQTLISYGVEHPKDIPEKHLRFLGSLPLYHVTSQYVFVHAGLNWKLPDVFSKSGATEMLWTRSEMTIPSRIADRTLITGHTTKTLDEIRQSLNTKHILTDNGCCLGTGFTKGKGNLVAINLDVGEMVVQPNIDGVDHDNH